VAYWIKSQDQDQGLWLLPIQDLSQLAVVLIIIRLLAVNFNLSMAVIKEVVKNPIAPVDAPRRCWMPMSLQDLIRHSVLPKAALMHRLHFNSIGLQAILHIELKFRKGFLLVILQGIRRAS
jgi:hypothetical protein